MSILFYFKLIEYTSAIIATIKYKKFASRFTALFLFYLWFICLIETLSPILAENGFPRQTTYTIYTFFEFNVLFLMYLSIIKVEFTKKVINYL